MEYIILAIGDEILAGQVVDTNSGALARMLEPEGFVLRRVEVIADGAEALEGALARALSEVRLVVTMGGLGPTRDDMTKETLCRMFGSRMIEDAEVLGNVKAVVARRGLKLNMLTARQAMVPECCRVIQNRVGTAPIMWFERPGGGVVVCMPGVPFETLEMMRSEVLGRLCDRFSAERKRLERQTVMTYGISESELAQRLAPFEDNLPDYVHLAYLPKHGVVRLRLDGRCDAGELVRWRDGLVASVPPGHLLAVGDVTLEQELSRRLRQRGESVSTAESCTGGNIAQRLTALPGASEVFMGGIVAYSNDMKVRILGVSDEDLEKYGAVSGPVVRAMAEGVRRVSGATYGVATSGIAGPGGGSAAKPVGTVWMAVSGPRGTDAWCVRFPGGRDRVIERASTEVMIRLVSELSE